MSFYTSALYAESASSYDDQPDNKRSGLFNCESMLDIPEHRSGWNYVKRLCTKHLHDPQGPVLVDFVEKIWCWKETNTFGEKDIYFAGRSFMVPVEEIKMIEGQEYVVLQVDGLDIVVFWNGTEWARSERVRPEKVRSADTYGVFTTPWVGIIHNPMGMPAWFDYSNSPQELIKKRDFLKSLPYCQGLLVFSEDLKQNLLSVMEWPCPIEVVLHPTEPTGKRWKPPPPKTISYDRSFETRSDSKKHAAWLNLCLHFVTKLFSKHKTNPVVKTVPREYRLVQVGYWLRRLTSIWEVQLPPHWNKYWINRADHGFTCLEKEIYHEHRGKQVTQNVVKTIQLSNDDYDRFLSESVMFIDLYDSSCNNTILEAIVRHVPIVARRLPATVEYLGEDYCLLFDSLDEIHDMLSSDDRILRAHEQLKRLEQSGRYYGEYFLNSMKKVSFLK